MFIYVEGRTVSQVCLELYGALRDYYGNVRVLYRRLSRHLTGTQQFQLVSVFHVTGGGAKKKRGADAPLKHALVILGSIDKRCFSINNGDSRK